MKIGDEVLIHGYIDEIRKDVVIIRNDGGYFGTVKTEILSREQAMWFGYGAGTKTEESEEEK